LRKSGALSPVDLGPVSAQVIIDVIIGDLFTSLFDAEKFELFFNFSLYSH
jgi:hypothetical protein